MPDISVAMLTYNQETYIRQAIESVLAQKTDYSFELVIGEDCSTDKTREIVAEYAERFPEKIKMLKREKNLGTIKNFVDVLRNCTGRYLAFLEGDDYWNSELKLQTQADFLEKNAEYSACFADVAVIDGVTGESLDSTWPFRKWDVVDYRALCSNWYIAIGTFVMRNIFTNFYFEQFLRSNFIGDRITLTIAVKHGPIKYIDTCLGVYRHGALNSFTSRSLLKNAADVASAFTVIYDLVDDGYEKEAVLSELKYCATWAKFLAHYGEKNFKCPVCGNELPLFLIKYSYYDYLVKKKHNMISSDMEGEFCKFCDSTALERHLLLYLDRLNFFESINDDTKILHIAPENILQSIFKQLTQSYTDIGIDMMTAGTQTLPFTDNYFNIIIGNNVFNRIHDDEEAMRELYRLLKKGGCAIFQTPYSPQYAGSLQYRVETERQLSECYGSVNVVRIYGMDLFEKLQKAGFDVNLVKHSSVFSENEAAYYGVNEKEDLIMCFKD